MNAYILFLYCIMKLTLWSFCPSQPGLSSFWLQHVYRIYDIQLTDFIINLKKLNENQSACSFKTLDGVSFKEAHLYAECLIKWLWNSCSCMSLPFLLLAALALEELRVFQGMHQQYQWKGDVLKLIELHRKLHGLALLVHINFLNWSICFIISTLGQVLYSKISKSVPENPKCYQQAFLAVKSEKHTKEQKIRAFHPFSYHLFRIKCRKQVHQLW